MAQWDMEGWNDIPGISALVREMRQPPFRPWTDEPFAPLTWDDHEDQPTDVTTSPAKSECESLVGCGPQPLAEHECQTVPQPPIRKRRTPAKNKRQLPDISKQQTRDPLIGASWWEPQIPPLGKQKPTSSRKKQLVAANKRQPFVTKDPLIGENWLQPPIPTVGRKQQPISESGHPMSTVGEQKPPRVRKCHTRVANDARAVGVNSGKPPVPPTIGKHRPLSGSVRKISTMGEQLPLAASEWPPMILDGIIGNSLNETNISAQFSSAHGGFWAVSKLSSLLEVVPKNPGSDLGTIPKVSIHDVVIPKASSKHVTAKTKSSQHEGTIKKTSKQQGATLKTASDVSKSLSRRKPAAPQSITGNEGVQMLSAELINEEPFTFLVPESPDRKTKRGRARSCPTKPTPLMQQVVSGDDLLTTPRPRPLETFRVPKTPDFDEAGGQKPGGTKHKSRSRHTPGAGGNSVLTNTQPSHTTCAEGQSVLNNTKPSHTTCAEGQSVLTFSITPLPDVRPMNT